MYDIVLDSLITSKTHRAQNSAKLALTEFSEKMNSFITEVSDYRPLVAFVILDKRNLFAGEHSETRENVDITVRTNGLLSQLLEIAGVTHHDELSFDLESAMRDLHDALSLNRADIESKRADVLLALETILVAVS